MHTVDYNRAELSYALAIRLNPEHYAPYADKARFYVRKGEPEAALVYYRKALALNPLDPGLEKHVGQLKKATAPDVEK